MKRDYFRGGLIGALIGVGVVVAVMERKEHITLDNKIERAVKQEEEHEWKGIEDPAVEQNIIDYKTDDFSEDNEEILLARMLFGEARNCSELERAGIAYTAVNRANDGKRWNGKTLREAVLKLRQYSCFNDGDPNRVKLMDPERYDKKSWEECLETAKKVLRGEYREANVGQTHYHTLNVNPAWASKIDKIGNIGKSKHLFYREN